MRDKTPKGKKKKIKHDIQEMILKKEQQWDIFEKFLDREGIAIWTAMKKRLINLFWNFIYCGKSWKFYMFLISSNDCLLGECIKYHTLP